jgi:hypothetical protein
MTHGDGKTKKMKADPVLGRFNLAMLHYTGYADAQITALGDLSELSEGKMQELVQKSPEAKIKAAVEDYEKSGQKFDFIHKSNSRKNESKKPQETKR